MGWLCLFVTGVLELFALYLCRIVFLMANPALFGHPDLVDTYTTS
jgi:hypothetical protein